MEYLLWAEKNWPFNPSFCPRHWMPCPVEGRNGIGASIEVMQKALDMMPEVVRTGGHTAMNSWQENQTTPTCCRLGDEWVAALWERWPPADEDLGGNDAR